MPTTHHAALESKHSALDQRIAEESARPSPDAQLLSDLKRQKLRLKEEMATL